MKPRRVLDRWVTPDGAPLELAVEGEHHVLRMRGTALMTSATSGSETAMATVAAEFVERPQRVLVGGLGMGFTCRAALDTFPDASEIAVVEIFSHVIEYNRGALGALAGHPLDDPRLRVVVSDVRDLLEEGEWDVVLLDVDNGPDAFTRRENASLYDRRGVERLARSLRPRGVVVVWSSDAAPRFEKQLRSTGLAARSRRVHARGDARRGPRHWLITGVKTG